MKVELEKWELWAIIDGLNYVINTIENLDCSDDEYEEELRLQSMSNLEKLQNKIKRLVGE